MYRKVAAALVVALGLALALASCGGSGTTTVSRAELVSRLETACTTAAAQTHGREQARREMKSYLSIIIANQKYVLSRVGNLETTGAAKPVFDNFKSVMRSRLAALERVSGASSSQFQSTLARERPLISASGPKTHEALVELGARHVCI